MVNRFRKYLAELAIQRFHMVSTQATKGPISAEVLGQYIAGSVIGLVNWWLESDMPISPEELAHQTLLLTAYGPYWGAGINPPEIKGSLT